MKRPQILMVMAWHNLIFGSLVLASGLLSLSRPDGIPVAVTGWLRLTAAAALFGFDHLCHAKIPKQTD